MTLSFDALDIPETIGIVSACWEAAEQDIRENLSRHAPGLEETEITSRFHEAFAKGLDEASASRAIENAFLADLRSADQYGDFDEWELRRIARGLVAKATLHPVETERVTGGDLGLVIVRPRLVHGFEELRIAAGHCRGLLSQAKLRRYGRRWGGLTRNQRKLLPNRISYLGLLLYRYRDRAARALEPFKWQVCSGYALDDVIAWLHHGNFPETVGSPEILRALASDRIGTSDRQIIETIIAPETSRWLEVRIDWPDGRPPQSVVRVLSKSEAKQLHEQKVYVRW